MTGESRPWLEWLRGFVLLALGLPALSAPARAQSPLTFREALARTQQHNEHWRAAEVDVNRAVQVQSAQRGLYWPSLNVIGLYAHLNDRLFVDLSDLGHLLSELNPSVPIPPLTATVLKNDPVKAGLSASWTVFTGGKIRAANRAARAGVEASRADQLDTQQGIMTELVERYFKRRLAAEILEVRRQALATLDRHLEDARRLRNAGQIARTDELRAQVAQSEADRDYKKALRDVELAAAALRATLGTDDSITPSSPMPDAASLQALEQYVSAADTHNPDLARLSALEDQSRQGIAAARADYFPAVKLFGQKELFQGHLNSTTDPKWIVGVEFKWQLFDGFGREHRLRAAQLVEQGLALRRDGARRDIRTLVQSRADDYASAAEQFTSLQSSLDLAGESLRSEQRAFTEGVGTSLAVVDAELSLSRIQVSRLNAQYDMIVALARLLEASGQSDRILEYIP